MLNREILQKHISESCTHLVCEKQANKEHESAVVAKSKTNQRLTAFYLRSFYERLFFWNAEFLIVNGILLEFCEVVSNFLDENLLKCKKCADFIKLRSIILSDFFESQISNAAKVFKTRQFLKTKI